MPSAFSLAQYPGVGGTPAMTIHVGGRAPGATSYHAAGRIIPDFTIFSRLVIQAAINQTPPA